MNFFSFSQIKKNTNTLQKIKIILLFIFRFLFLLLFYLTCSNYIFYVFLSVKFEKHNKYVDCTVTLHV